MKDDIDALFKRIVSEPAPTLEQHLSSLGALTAWAAAVEGWLQEQPLHRRAPLAREFMDMIEPLHRRLTNASTDGEMVAVAKSIEAFGDRVQEWVALNGGE